MRKISFKMLSDDVYKTYIMQVKRIPLLTLEEERELSDRAIKGDEDAIRRLIEANLRIVIKIGQKYVGPGISLMDIIQEGNFGLMRAVEKFDSSKNVRFATYAVLWIKQSIIRFVASKRRVIRLPFKKEELLRKIYIAEHILQQRLGRTPKLDEIAAETNCSAMEVKLVLNVSSNPLSLETELLDNENNPSSEILDDSRQDNPEREFLMRSSRKETRCFLKRYLSVRERNVILYRFRFVDSDTYTFKKLGDIMGISAEAVRQIEKRALRKIRTKSDELFDCVYA